MGIMKQEYIDWAASHEESEPDEGFDDVSASRQEAEAILNFEIEASDETWEQVRQWLTQ